MQSAMRSGLPVVAVLLGLFGGSAEATPFDKVEGWWNSLDCPRRNAAVSEYDPTLMAEGMDSGFCVMYEKLGESEKAIVDMAAAEVGGDYDSIQFWWEDLHCGEKSIAVGYAQPQYCAHFMNAPKARFDPKAAGNLNNLTEEQEEVVAIAGYALATGMVATFEEIKASDLWMPFIATPALPLAGVVILALLLAGRGMRRRHTV